MNIKCPRCNTIYNGNFCPNCGLPKQQFQPFTNAPKQKRKMHGCLITLIVFISAITFVAIVSVIMQIVGTSYRPFMEDDVSCDNIATQTPIPEKIVFDATKFIDENGKTVSEKELIKMLGKPEKIEKWNYVSYQSLLGKKVKYPIRSLIYEKNKYVYNFNNDCLQRITITDQFSYKNKKDILPMFGLREYANTKITDTNWAYKCSNCGVYQFWIYDMDSESKMINGIHISYGNLFE